MMKADWINSTGFANSAEEISFELEGDDSVPILRANLWNVEGELVGGDINLAERINNNNGEFTFGESSLSLGEWTSC
jgi:hypothetical protein